ncbi:9206_t:CDS:1, partial [Racocetra fulgida]
WFSQYKENNINILAEDFNTNLDPAINRISQASAQSNNSRMQLKEL